MHHDDQRLVFRFERLHPELPMQRDLADILLRLVADFSIVVDDRLLYREPGFPVVELACSFLGWLKHEPQPGDDFEFDSMDIEEPGWVWFRSVGQGWRVGSIHQEYPESRVFSRAELQDAITDFIDRLVVAARQDHGLKLRPYLRPLPHA